MTTLKKKWNEFTPLLSGCGYSMKELSFLYKQYRNGQIPESKIKDCEYMDRLLDEEIEIETEKEEQENKTTIKTTIKSETEKLYEKYFAPSLKLKDGYVMIATSELINKLPFITTLLDKTKFNEGIKVKIKKDGTREIIVPPISLNLSKRFVDYLIEGVKKSGDLALYQDFADAKVYDINLKSDELFDLDNIDIKSCLLMRECQIMDLYELYFSDIPKNKFIGYILTKVNKDEVQKKKIGSRDQIQHLFFENFRRRYI